MKPHRTPPPAHKARPKPSRYPLSAIAFLALIVLLGLTTLALAAYLALTTGPTTRVAAIPTLTPLRLPTGPGRTAEPGPPVLPGAVACAPKDAPLRRGRVTRILDSGALEVQVAGETQSIGFAGIQLGYLAAQPAGQGQPALPQALVQLVGQPVLLLQDPAVPDTEGPKPRYVVAGDRFVNADLVRQGQAIVLTGAPRPACAAALLELERQARAEGRGIWKSPTPVPTRTFMPFVTLEPVTPPGCVCSQRPTCGDFKTHAAAQACLNACNDYNSRLDEDHDGLACEDLP